MSSARNNEKNVARLIEEYAEAAAAHGKASSDGDYKKANRNHDIIADVRCELMERGDEGKTALLDLLTHPDPSVRTWAAAHSLQFDAQRAEATLVEVAQSDAGIVSFAAEMTLEQWKKEELSFPER